MLCKEVNNTEATNTFKKGEIGTRIKMHEISIKIVISNSVI